MTNAVYSGGFTDPPVEAARAFRVLMNAMARPGSVGVLRGAVPPAPVSVAAGTALLTLCDPGTPVYLSPAFRTPDVEAWIAFHTGAPLCAKSDAVFALGDWADLSDLGAFPQGSAQYPDRSATLIVELAADATLAGVELSGSGLAAPGASSLPETQAFKANARLYPRGLDFYFTQSDQIRALPRSTKVEAA